MDLTMVMISKMGIGIVLDHREIFKIKNWKTHVLYIFHGLWNVFALK
jgi:tRNA(Ser,Leu) C12 N-acetylase TAN1